MQRKGRGKLEDMFDPEVIALLRKQFQEADVDGSGQIDAEEAVVLFARHCAPGASEAEIKKTADGLRNQMDSSRDGLISFEEYAFRFGRKLQMDVARARRGGSLQNTTVGEIKAEFVPPTQKYASQTHSSAATTSPSRTHEPSNTRWNTNVSSSSSSSSSSPGWSRESLTWVGIVVVMLAIAIAAVLIPAPGNGKAGQHAKGHSKTTTAGSSSRRGASSTGR